MIKATAIKLKKATGLTSSLGEREYTGADKWEQANAQLREWRLFVGSVDDVDFEVVYEDGSAYKGTIELNAAARLTEQLGEHMRAFCETYGGRKKPYHLSDEQYKEMLRIYAPEPIEHTRWLDEYEIGE